MFVRVLYIIFLGILVALFVVWAMASLFPTPSWDTTYPDVREYRDAPYLPSEQELSVLTPDQRAQKMQAYEADKATYDSWKTEHDQLQKDFDKKMQAQGRTVALLSLLIAVVVVTGSLWYSGELQVITEGLLLGGIFTLIYSIGWSIARAPKIAVLVVGVGLVVTIVVGYVKFVKRALPKPAA
jgi:hypothetical protein